jgi:hypothetical protein
MVDIIDERIFKCMGERPMANIMQQNSDRGISRLLFADGNILQTQTVDGVVHQVHSPDRMMKTGVQGPGVNHIGHAQLLNPPQTLKPGVIYQVEDQVIAHRNKTINRIVKYFSAAEGGMPHLNIIFVKEFGL